MIAKETGKPLIQYAWENAIESASVTDVYIATDSDEIATICTDFGAKVIMTGEHPNGTSRIAEAVQNIECDVVVNMQGDEPELSASVIDAAIDVLGDCSMATAACQLQEDELENENVVKICVEKNQALDFSRQEGEFRHIGLYVYTPEFLQTYVQMQPTQNEISRKLEQMRAIDNGFAIAVAMVDPQAGGIDTREQYDEFVTRVGSCRGSDPRHDPNRVL